MSEMYPVKVPDFIMKMSKEELDREIARLEAEAKARREVEERKNSAPLPV